MSEKKLFHRIAARYRKNKLLSFLLRATGKEVQPRKWVFIVGCYNSGTTLFEQILSLHPEVSSLHDEGVILTDQLKRPEDFGYHRYWLPVIQNIYLKPEDPASVQKAKVIKRQWSHFYDSSKSVFVEKSISNALRIDFLDQFFAPAYFIYLIRNGYAVSEGIKRKVDPKRFKNAAINGYTLAMCSQQWRESDLVIRKALEGKRHMTVFYEELTENPCPTVSRVCEFLELAPMDCSQFEKPFRVHGNTSLIKNMNSSSIQKLTPEDIKVIQETAGDVLEFYHYTP